MKQIAFNENVARDIQAGHRFGKIMTRDGFEVTILHWAINTSFPTMPETSSATR